MKKAMMALSIAVAILFSGCAFSAADVAAEMNEGRTERYAAYSTTQKEMNEKLLAALEKVDRGGMSISLDESGRVAGIKYTERLDMAQVMNAVRVAPYQEEKVQSIIGELGDLLSKGGSVITAGIYGYYGNKNHEVTSRYSFMTQESNNNRELGMMNSYTGSFQSDNTVVVDPTVVRPEVVNQQNIEVVKPEVIEPTVYPIPTQVVNPAVVNPQVIEVPTQVVSPQIVETSNTSNYYTTGVSQ